MNLSPHKLEFGPRRAVFVDIGKTALTPELKTDAKLVKACEDLDLVYRTLCAILYNFVPTSGHPGGSISSGRMVEALLYSTMSYEMGDPDNLTADIISYAAGHKAMGLYAMWALRNEICRQFSQDLLPKEAAKQLRLEDLIGFRRNPTQSTPLFKEFKAKALDGHPTPLTPFVKLATGASGVGLASSIGLGFAARDYFGADAPFVHVIEGEGGITPGRTHEAMAAAAAAQVSNIVLHMDWNQASIDSNQVCREGDKPGDYVQWDPLEYAYLHDWNVIYVEKGLDFEQIIAAQRIAVSRLNNQPTMVVYRTIKGWRYGIEGRLSHGAGHKFDSPEFYSGLQPFEERFGARFPRFSGEKSEANIEACYWSYLKQIREALLKDGELVQTMGSNLKNAGGRLRALKRKPKKGAPQVEKLYSFKPQEIPPELVKSAGQSDTLRGALGTVLNYLNHASQGAVFVSAADLCGSTSISNANDGFPGGFWNAVSNPDCRMLALGGICEDGMGGIASGLSAFGKAIGVCASYGAFIAALQHVAARLHGIGQQNRKDYNGEHFKPFILVCAHAGLKTGEDGPTHADPQPLQLLQENFPAGIMITLTPWDANEMWPLLIAALNLHPAVIAPFVTRPNETILDRQKHRLPPLPAAAQGVYAVRRARQGEKTYHGTVMLQGSCVMNDFVTQVLPKIDDAGLNLNVYYVSSAELFDALPEAERAAILPAGLKQEAIGITGFTLPTMQRWIHSEEGLRRTLHPFRHGRFPGSGQAAKVLQEAGLNGEAQWAAIQDYARWMEQRAERM